MQICLVDFLKKQKEQGRIDKGKKAYEIKKAGIVTAWSKIGELVDLKQ